MSRSRDSSSPCWYVITLLPVKSLLFPTSSYRPRTRTPQAERRSADSAAAGARCCGARTFCTWGSAYLSTCSSQWSTLSKDLPAECPSAAPPPLPNKEPRGHAPGVCHVVHDHDALAPAVVAARDRPEALLPGSVPLQRAAGGSRERADASGPALAAARAVVVRARGGAGAWRARAPAGT